MHPPRVEGGHTGVGDLVDYVGPQQAAVGRQIDPEILLGGVVDDLVREVGTEKRFAAHQRQHPASRVVQPVDRAFGHVLGHSADAVVERPTVVTVEVALPLVEQVGNDGMKLARHHARAEERERPALRRAVNVLGFVFAMPVLGEEILVPRQTSTRDTAGTQGSAAAAPCHPEAAAAAAAARAAS